MQAIELPLIAGCALALVSALAVVLVRRPVYAAVALLGHSLSLAGLFALLAADMVAVGQVIIYSGAIVVLFLFVVTLLPAGGLELRPRPGRATAAAIAAAALLVAFGAVVASGAPAATADLSQMGIAQVGRALFGSLLVAFELTAPLLLVAVVGAVVIWRRHEPRMRPSSVAAPPRAAERKVVMHR